MTHCSLKGERFAAHILKVRRSELNADAADFLFNVSEIKRVKGGGVEVKLFDRLKALEKLFELENSFSDRDKANDLIKALSDSAEDGDAIDN